MGQVLITDNGTRIAVFNKLKAEGVAYSYQTRTHMLSCTDKTDAELQYIVTNSLTAELIEALVFNESNGITETIELPTDLSKAKAQAKRIIQNATANMRASFMYGDDYTRDEPVGWGDKVAIAERVIATTATADEIAIVQLEADARSYGETVLALAAKQVEKAMRLRKARSVLDGNLRKALANIDVALEVQTLKDVYGSFVASVRTALLQIEAGEL